MEDMHLAAVVEVEEEKESKEEDVSREQPRTSRLLKQVVALWSVDRPARLEALSRPAYGLSDFSQSVCQTGPGLVDQVHRVFINRRIGEGT